MIIPKPTSFCKNGTITNHCDLDDLYNAIKKFQIENFNSGRIFIWQNFGANLSESFPEMPNWEENFVGLFGNQEMWPWLFRLKGERVDRVGNEALLELLQSSVNNIIASLRIRHYESNDSFRGSLEWFEDIEDSLNNQFYESRQLISNIIQNLRLAREFGINLFLEKISIIASDDSENFETLTPQLHRDGAYGHLESAIVSFYSKRITPFSSTLFFPDFDFEAASHMKPITAAKLNRHFNDANAFYLASGDLAIFSGKLTKEGVKNDSCGALHISPEGFFSTRRLVLLFKCNINSTHTN